MAATSRNAIARTALAFRARLRPPRDVRRMEWESRRIFLQTAAAMTPYVAVETDDGLVFFVSTSDVGVGRALFARRTRGDLIHLATATRLVSDLGLDPSGTNFVDVGANIGTTTVSALRRHGFASAVALEPVASNVALLRLNALVNGVEADVRALEIAVASHEETRTLSLSKGSGGHRLVSPNRNTTREKVEVATTTLDALVEGGVIDPSAVGLLWIDTPGAETEVLTGASTLLGAGVPVVVVARGKSKWERRSAALANLLGGYTDFADLHARGPVTTDLGGLLESLTGRTTDLLAVKRPRR